MITPRLETPRLLLRLAKITDAQAIYANWTADPEVSQFMRWEAHGSVNETTTWLTDVTAKADDPNSYDWLFVLKETGQPIGSGGIYFNEKHGMFELGYCLMKACWGRGFAVEASQAILQFATDTLNQREFFACHADINPASGKVLEKLGFVYKNDGEYSSFDGSRVFKSHRYFLKVL